MSIQAQKFLISVDDYHKMGEAGILPERGVELINGEIFEMSPIGSRHVKTVNKLTKLLSKMLGDEAIVSIQNPIIADNLSEPEPDIAILKYRSDFYGDKLPNGEDVLLIIEVADTSLSYDRQLKLPLYASSGVSECWLIDLENLEIHAYWEPSGRNYRFSQLAKAGDTLSAKNFNLEIEVSTIFS